MMKFTLMNYEYETAEIEVNDDGTAVMTKILDCDRIPFAIQYSIKETMDDDFTRWMHQRIIPDNRKGLARLWLVMPEDMLKNSLLYGRGQSLSDGFWFRRDGSQETYESISYRKNGFPEELGEYILMNGHAVTESDLDTPELTTNGMLAKAWKMKDGIPYLYKMGSYPNHEEPYNEVMASKIMEKLLNIPCVEYSLEYVAGRPVSVCKGFLHDDEELVTAEEILESTERKPGWTIDMMVRQRCRELQIPDADDFLNEMQSLDYLISNEDRHLGNYGFIRDVKTLHFKGPAPIYDNGTSLWVDDAELNGNTNIDKTRHAIAKAIRHGMRLFKNGKDLEMIAEDVYKNSGISRESFKKLTDGLSERNVLLKREAEKAIGEEALDEQFIERGEAER